MKIKSWHISTLLSKVSTLHCIHCTHTAWPFRYMTCGRLQNSCAVRVTVTERAVNEVTLHSLLAAEENTCEDEYAWIIRQIQSFLDRERERRQQQNVKRGEEDVLCSQNTFQLCLSELNLTELWTQSSASNCQPTLFLHLFWIYTQLLNENKWGLTWLLVNTQSIFSLDKYNSVYASYRPRFHFVFLIVWNEMFKTLIYSWFWWKKVQKYVWIYMEAGLFLQFSAAVCVNTETI